MSTTVIKPNAGTPFEQIVSMSLKAASKPKLQTSRTMFGAAAPSSSAT
jgi:hypothetical protein